MKKRKIYKKHTNNINIKNISKKKNILLINHYAGSPEMGMEFRPYYFAKEWVKDGYRVNIIAADFSHLRLKNPKIKKDFDEEIIDGIYYYWVHTLSYNGNGGKRALTMFQFVGKLLLSAKIIAKNLKPDVIITSSTYPLDPYAGQRIKKLCLGTETILIHEIHDMWPITPVEIGGMAPSHPFIKMLQKAEDSFCKKSDRVISLLSNASEYLQEHGMSPEKFIHIANGVVKEEWEKITPLSKDIQNKIDFVRNLHQKIICFFGSHTVSYALDYIVDAVKQIPSNDIGLLMVGEGVYKDELIERAKGTNNVHFFDRVPKKSIPDLLRQVDIIYIGALNNKMFKFGICMNKLFDSMMSGKPILYAVNSPNNYVRDFGCGISVEPESTDQLINGINRFLKMEQAELDRMGENGRKAVLSYFTTEVLAKKFEECF